MGYKDNDGAAWLDSFCAEFVRFSTAFQHFLKNVLKHSLIDEGNEYIPCCNLCLFQITTCVKNIERTLKMEKTGNIKISDARHHFLNRILYCLEKLGSAVKELESVVTCKNYSPYCPSENWSFIELMDAILNSLKPYSCTFQDKNLENVAETNAEAVFASKQIRSYVNSMLGQAALALANVALQKDKQALSALCQKVLRECLAFEKECSLIAQSNISDSNRKLKAAVLEKSLFVLEDYLNESLLRLVFRCFLDFQKLSIDKLRVLLRMCEGQEEPALLDDFIADFDVNIDRASQIGNFAIAFAPSLKAKTTLRSSLASFESLDACIIPAMHGKSAAASIYSEILEQHFNEEVESFKKAIQEIIDSYAFTSCYHDILTEGVKNVEKKYDVESLQEMVQMGEILNIHFQIRANNNELQQKPERLQMYGKFKLMLCECQAILMCANQVDSHRVIKRFKILGSIVHKFLDTLKESQDSNSSTTSESSKHKNQFETGIKQKTVIAPSKRSLLCRPDKDRSSYTTRQFAAICSLQGNISKGPLVVTPQHVAAIENVELNKRNQASGGSTQTKAKVPTSTCKDVANAPNEHRNSIRRKESLRTAMFKRQTTIETAQIYSIYKSNSTSLQITEILDQLSGLSSDFLNV